MRRIIITVDGHSSTGKSTVAKQMAAELGYIYIDSGAMYRSVTLYAIEHGLITQNALDKSALLEALPEIKINFISIGISKSQPPVFQVFHGQMPTHGNIF